MQDVQQPLGMDELDTLRIRTLRLHLNTDDFTFEHRHRSQENLEWIVWVRHPAPPGSVLSHTSSQAGYVCCREDHREGQTNYDATLVVHPSYRGHIEHVLAELLHRDLRSLRIPSVVEVNTHCPHALERWGYKQIGADVAGAVMARSYGFHQDTERA